MHTLEQLRAGTLAGARHLKLACGLREFPREIFELADTLEILDLADNELTTLPDDLPRLTRLRVLFCSGNPFTHLPEVLGDCPVLQMVGFKGCQLAYVPGAALSPSLSWLTLTDRLPTAAPLEAVAKAHPDMSLGSYPFFSPPDVYGANLVLRGRDDFPPFSLAELSAMVPRTVGRELRKLGYFLPRAIPLLILTFVPVLNLLAAPLWILFGVWMMAVQYIDYPCDNNKVSWDDMLAWLREKRWQSLGFGGTVYLSLLIPFVNILVMPAAVAGATLFWVRERDVTAQ